MTSAQRTNVWAWYFGVGTVEFSIVQLSPVEPVTSDIGEKSSKLLPDSKASPDAAHEYYCEFLLKCLTETANALTKASAFYLAIMAALTGYLLSQRLSPQLRDLTFYIEAAVSLFAVVTGVCVAAGLHTGLWTYERALRKMNPALFDDLKIHAFCRRGRIILWVAITFFLLMIAMFVWALMRFRHALAP